MFGYMVKPVTDKISSDESNDTIVCGASSMKGWRMTQDDAHNCILDYDEGASLFAVYDGHGGNDVAEYTSQKLPDFIKQTESYTTGDYEKALKDAFLKFDSTLKETDVVAILKEIQSREDKNKWKGVEYEFRWNRTGKPGSDSGCTAVVALLKSNKIYVANAGDSRCIVSKGGKAVEMSIDHKPEDEIEFERITKAGGKVNCGRVNGDGLNLSRALGDHIYKQVPNLPPEDQMISPLPDVKIIDVDPDVEFMFLACDGIWNSMSSKEVVAFVRPRLLAGVDRTSKICEELFEHCLATATIEDGAGYDNMTAIIVQFKNSNLSSSKKRRGEADDGTKRPKTGDVSSTDSVGTSKPEESVEKDSNTPDTTQ